MNRTISTGVGIIILILIAAMAMGIIFWKQHKFSNFFSTPQNNYGYVPPPISVPDISVSQNPIPVPIGGPCSRDKYTGTCKIISVAKTEASKEQVNEVGGPGYEGYEVKYKFIPNETIDIAGSSLEQAMRQMMNGGQLLQLYSSWYPGSKFIEKYGIKKDAIFECEMSVITQGTCSPVVFEFNKIDLGDYFETKI
jgi:hypothetical protein